MKTTAQHLGMTELEYDFFYFEAYMRWCLSVSITPAEFQMVLANTSVNKYYNTELAKIENEFVSLLATYPNATTEDAKKLYGRCTFDMFNRRSPELIKNAKKLNLTGYDTARQN